MGDEKVGAMASTNGKGRASSVISNTENAPTEATASKQSKKDKVGGTIKLKRPPMKMTNAGSWQDNEVTDQKPKKSRSPSSTSATSPVPNVKPPDPDLVATNPTGRLNEDEQDVATCKHCRKVWTKSVLPKHAKECLKQKQENAKRRKEAKEAKAKAKEAKEAASKDKDSDTIMDETPKVKATAEGEDAPSVEKVKTAKKSAVIGEDGPKKGKKRKADGEGEKAPKTKKKKEEPKPKVPKPKGEEFKIHLTNV
ncbi:MAG: hypothetical protein M1835_001146 [Candelina submexicana]|nr:MAG: hypothetical protein M1835_001146 [Candelina submexicana]